MASPGHTPIKNTDRLEVGERVLESAGPPRTSKVSLPYYRRPPLRRDPRRTLEGFTEAASAADVESDVVTDVAAASFGTSAANTDPVVMEAVIGTDDRVRVTKQRMATNPWRQICALRIVSQTDRTFVGTGWFISPGVLTTAGHCVFLQDEGGWAKSIRVIPAKFGSDEPFSVLTSRKFGSVDGWVKQRGRDFDYGVIFLDDVSAGTQVGNFAVEALGGSALKGTDAQISGYPADRDRAEFQYFHARQAVMKSAPGEPAKRNQANEEEDNLGPLAGKESTHAGIPAQ